MLCVYLHAYHTRRAVPFHPPARPIINYVIIKYESRHSVWRKQLHFFLGPLVPLGLSTGRVRESFCYRHMHQPTRGICVSIRSAFIDPARLSFMPKRPVRICLHSLQSAPEVCPLYVSRSSNLGRYRSPALNSGPSSRLCRCLATPSFFAPSEVRGKG